MATRVHLDSADWSVPCVTAEGDGGGSPLRSGQSGDSVRGVWESVVRGGTWWSAVESVKMETFVGGSNKYNKYKRNILYPLYIIYVYSRGNIHLG